MTALYTIESAGAYQLLLLGWFVDESPQLGVKNAQLSSNCNLYTYLHFTAICPPAAPPGSEWLNAWEGCVPGTLMVD